MIMLVGYLRERRSGLHFLVSEPGIQRVEGSCVIASPEGLLATQEVALQEADACHFPLCLKGWIYVLLH